MKCFVFCAALSVSVYSYAESPKKGSFPASLEDKSACGAIVEGAYFLDRSWENKIPFDHFSAKNVLSALSALGQRQKIAWNEFINAHGETAHSKTDKKIFFKALMELDRINSRVQQIMYTVETLDAHGAIRFVHDPDFAPRFAAIKEELGLFHRQRSMPFWPSKMNRERN